jgi:hypothetical protein
MRPGRAEVLLRLAPAAAAAAWCAVAARFAGPFEVCGFHWLTGLPCPLCGMTRALAALAGGHWNEALAFHALSPLAAALLLLGPLLAFRPALERRAWKGTVSALAVFGVVRILGGV